MGDSYNYIHVNEHIKSMSVFIFVFFMKISSKSGHKSLCRVNI